MQVTPYKNAKRPSSVSLEGRLSFVLILSLELIAQCEKFLEPLFPL